MNFKIISVLIFILTFPGAINSKDNTEGSCVISIKPVFSFSAYGENGNVLLRPRDIAVSKNGNIYILDTGDCKIKCFSYKGDFLFSFGREGQGPGEFSRYSSKLKCLNDSIYLIDNYQRRILCFSLEGKFKTSFKTLYSYSDILFFKGKYFLTNFELESGHRPIHITRDFKKVEKEFGEIIDPADFFKIKEFSVVRSSISLENISSIVINYKGEVFYTQCNPYKIIKYSAEGKKLKEFSRKTPFDTKLKIHIKGEGEMVNVWEEPSSLVPEIYLIKNDLILVPIFSPDLKENYIDVYNSEGNLLYACKFPLQLYGENTIVIATEFDGKNFYILYFSPHRPPTLSKFEISLPFA